MQFRHSSSCDLAYVKLKIQYYYWVTDTDTQSITFHDIVLADNNILVVLVLSVDYCWDQNLELDNIFYPCRRQVVCEGCVMSAECWDPGHVLLSSAALSPSSPWTIENQTLIQPHQPGIYMLMWTIQWHYSCMDPPLIYVFPGSIWCVFYVIVHPSDGGKESFIWKSRYKRHPTVMYTNRNG